MTQQVIWNLNRVSKVECQYSQRHILIWTDPVDQVIMLSFYFSVANDHYKSYHDHDRDMIKILKLLKINKYKQGNDKKQKSL